MKTDQKFKKNKWNIIARYLFAFALVATMFSLPLGHMDFYESPESFKLKIILSIVLWLLFVVVSLLAACQEWRQAKAKKWLTILYTLPLLFLATSAIHICVLFLSIFQEVPLNFVLANQVVNMIQTSQLKPSPHGSLQLPAQFQKLSKNGDAYVTRRNNGLLLVYFPALDYPFLRGTLYSSQPLTDVPLNMGDFPATVKANALGIQDAPLLIKSRININWYSISRE